jgi:hypothetical protein
LKNCISSARKTCTRDQLAERAVYYHLLAASGHENHRLRNIVKLINEAVVEVDGSWIFDTKCLVVRCLDIGLRGKIKSFQNIFFLKREVTYKRILQMMDLLVFCEPITTFLKLLETYWLHIVHYIIIKFRI